MKKFINSSQSKSCSKLHSFIKFTLKFLFLVSLLLIIIIFIFAFSNIIRPASRLKSNHLIKSPNYFYFNAINEHNQIINACYVKASNSKGTIILCHGHGGTHLDLVEIANDLKKYGINSLLLDFRAHGNSDGTFTTLGLYEWYDILCVINKATEYNYISSDTFIAAYGRSMGASALINGAKNLNQIKIFILESPFSDLKTIAARDFSRLTRIPKSNYLINIGIHIISFITSIPYNQNIPLNNAKYFENRPVLLIHDALDTRATIEDHLLLKENIPNASEWIVENANHVQAYKINSDLFINKLLELLAKNNFPINDITQEFQN